MIKSIVMSCLILFLLVEWDIARADEDIDTRTSTIKLTIPAACRLVVSNGNIAETLDTGESSRIAFDQGYYDFITNDTLTVDANKAWELKVKVSTDWDLIGTHQKDTGDLKLKITSSAGHQIGFTDFASLSLTDQQIASYTAGVSNGQCTCSYRIMLDWMKDIPGTYQITLTYTVSTMGS